MPARPKQRSSLATWISQTFGGTRRSGTRALLFGERGSGNWVRITWNEALDTIVERLQDIKHRYGAEAVDFHHGHYHSGEIFGVYLSRLGNLFGTPNVTNPSHIVSIPLTPSFEPSADAAPARTKNQVGVFIRDWID